MAWGDGEMGTTLGRTKQFECHAVCVCLWCVCVCVCLCVCVCVCVKLLVSLKEV
jgi:hypothetical protein